jgi:site-specific recombinase XerD
MQKNANKYSAFINDRKLKGDKASTIKTYKNELNLFFRFINCEIEDITPSIIRAYLANLNTTRKSSFGAFAVLRIFFNWYWDEYDLDIKNPIKKVKVSVPKVNPKQPFSDNDIKKLLMVASIEKNNLRNTAIINVMLDTGLRSFELINLNIENVDFDNNSIYILRGKGNKTRVVLFGIETAKALKLYLNTRKEISNDAPLFIGIKSERLNYYSLRRIILNLCEKTSVDYKGLHSMRRKFCLDVFHSGMNLMLIQKLMGHERQSQTQTYLKLDIKDIIENYKSPIDRLI